jgi:predicted nucleic acid-binding protein
VWLADTSAWVWSRRPDDPARRARFDGLVAGGEIAVCDMVKLELLKSARNATEFSERAGQLDGLPSLPIGSEQWQRALWVYGELAKQGGAHQRSVDHPDLLIAAAAEAAAVPVLHYDEDYDRIAGVTGQECEWLN